MGPFCLDNLEWDWWKVKTFYLAFEVISTIEDYLISAAMTLINRAANNFPAGAGQIVQSNVFWLGHIPFLAGQTSIIIILNL